MSAERGLLELQRITQNFSEDFRGAGYLPLSQVAMSSGVDASVRLIGAPISVLKPYLGSPTLETSGKFLVQDCIRTHNLKTLFEIDEQQEYGSFFTGLGALAASSQVQSLFEITSNFLSKQLEVKPNEAFISVYGEDEDLLTAAEQNGFFVVNADLMEPAYYRHTYGMDGVYGRNTSYWVKNRSSGVYEDIGNIIAIESNKGDSLGAEFAFGDSTLVKQLAGLDHVTDAYDLQLASQAAPKNLRIRLEDCVITSMALASEGLVPSAQSNQTRILRTYVKGASLFRRLLDIDTQTLGEKLVQYEEGYFPFDARNAGKLLLQWTVEYENRVSNQGASNKEDLKILSLLSGYSND